ncbi:MAG: integrin alpha, partial [Anaerolineae bacterium]
NNNDWYGVSVAGAGDVDGDGYADVLAGAPRYDNSRGKVYAYFGNDGGGRRVLTEQRNTDRDEVQPWGQANATDRFEAWLWASSPTGRGRLKLQAEACPPGAAFGDAACITATGDTWEDLFPSGGYATQRRLRLVVEGLDGDTLYHWRARVLYAPYTVLRTGITPPPNPAHGPWLRFQAQTFEADLRTLAGQRVFLPLVMRNQ